MSETDSSSQGNGLGCASAPGSTSALTETEKELQQIRLLLEERLPRPAEPRQFWRRPALVLSLIGLILLMMVSFPSENRSHADLVIPDGGSLDLVLKPAPAFAELGLPPNPRYRDLPDLLGENMTVIGLFSVELRRQGQVYDRTAVRVRRSSEGLVAEFVNPVVVTGPTRLEFIPFRAHEDDRRLIRSVVENYGLLADQHGYPLLQFINLRTFEGYLVIETKAPMGPRRLRENADRLWSLFF